MDGVLYGVVSGAFGMGWNQSEGFLKLRLVDINNSAYRHLFIIIIMITAMAYIA